MKVMYNQIEQIIRGQQCPKCRQKELYWLSDRRLKCSSCYYRFSANKIRDDLTLLHYFSLGIPAHKAAKALRFSYRKVRAKYMQYRGEIMEYLKQPGRMPSLSPKGARRLFWTFAWEKLSKYPRMSREHFALYLKEMEFRYLYRRKNIFDVLLRMHFGPVFNY